MCIIIVLQGYCTLNTLTAQWSVSVVLLPRGGRKTGFLKAILLLFNRCMISFLTCFLFDVQPPNIPSSMQHMQCLLESLLIGCSDSVWGVPDRYRVQNPKESFQLIARCLLFHQKVYSRDMCVGGFMFPHMFKLHTRPWLTPKLVVMSQFTLVGSCY